MNKEIVSDDGHVIVLTAREYKAYLSIIFDPDHPLYDQHFKKVIINEKKIEKK